MHAFICIHGKPNIHGEKIRGFVHRPQFEPNCYVWENRELSLKEYGEIARMVVEANIDLRPYGRVVGAPLVAGEAEKTIARLEQQLAQAGAELLKLRATVARRAAKAPAAVTANDEMKAA